MKALLEQLEMPLLLRELKELASSKRTYIIRFAYAGTLFLLACGVFFGNFGNSNAGGLGRGRQMFSLLVNIQIYGMMLLIPAITAGVITVEKERDALGVLLLTTLGPLRIVTQKLLGRLIPAFSFLLMGLPLLAVAYSYGGVPDDLLFSSIALLFAAAVHIAVISLFSSVWAASTTQALLQSWILLGLSYFILQPAWLPHIFERLQGPEKLFSDEVVWGAFVLNVIPILILFSASVFCLNARAFSTSQNYMMTVFKALDQLFNEANVVTGGVVLVKDSNKSPKMHPVAWRETARKSLGTFRYQFRVLSLLLVPILFVCQLVRLDMTHQNSSVNIMLLSLWSITLLLVIVHGASLVSSERSRQTLNVLLTTPITGASILSQKWVGLRRMLIVLFVPFATISVFKAWFTSGLGSAYIMYSMMGYVVVFPIAAWVSVWIGLRMRSQVRAILTSIGVIVALAVIPFAVQAAMSIDRFPLEALNPVQFLADVELQHGRWHLSRWHDFLLFVLIFGSLGIAARLACRFGIDERLGRVPKNFKQDERFTPPQST